MSAIETARFQVALTRAKVNGHIGRLYAWLAQRLPHEFVSRVLAHVGAATIRDNEHPAEALYMELFRRWDHRELQGKAAERHERD